MEFLDLDMYDGDLDDVLDYLYDGDFEDEIDWGSLDLDELAAFDQFTHQANHPESDNFKTIMLFDHLDVVLYDCGIPTISQAVEISVLILIQCFLIRAIVMMDLGLKFNHLVSMALGCTAMWLFFREGLFYVTIPLLIGAIVIFLPKIFNLDNHGKCGVIVSGLCVGYLIIFELFIVDPVKWHTIRGSQMIIIMKIISFAFDKDSLEIKPHHQDDRMRDELDSFSILQYFGYCLHVGSSIFGPWVSFENYKKSLLPTAGHKSWLYHVVSSSFLSLFCLFISSCVSTLFFHPYSNKWLVAYQAALSFRFSHYFISFLSETTVIMSGVGHSVVTDEKEKQIHKWYCSVARPLHIEIPRSLVEVVTNWNIPMHTWLKTYVFKKSRPLGTFLAVLLTYIASSLLHGVNFQLAAVLLSLGFYSYIEHVLRRRLGIIFSACVLAKKCQHDCGHSYRSANAIVWLVNLSFGVLAMFHLAYLGLMFDSNSQEEEEQGYTMEHTLSKWADLHFLSHLVAVGSYIFYILI